MPLVQIATVSEKQTDNTMRHVRAMANKKAAPRLHRDYDNDPGKTQINIVPEEEKLEVITSSAMTQEGAEATFIVGDELEHWTPGNGGTKLLQHPGGQPGQVRKPDARDPECLGTGPRHVGWRSTFQPWCLQENGKSKNDRHILMDIHRPR